METTCPLKGQFLHMDSILREGINDWQPPETSDGATWLVLHVQRGRESIDHLFLHYNIASELWYFIFTLIGIRWVMPCHLVDLLACWSGCLCSVRSYALWGLIPHFLMWVIWREQNARRSFEDIERSTQELKQSFLTILFEWANASGLFHFHSLYELINSCQLTL